MSEPGPKVFQSVVMRGCAMCEKPATHQIIGHPGNVNYGYVCAKHEKAKLRDLRKAWGAK